MKTKIHVNRHHIAANRKNGNSDLPIYTVKDYKRNRKGNSVTIHGPSAFVYRPRKPLPCGAVAWLETLADVEVS